MGVLPTQDGTVTRTAGALDPRSRTMQVEVQVPNHEGKLYAGMYGEVKFTLHNENAPIVVPANSFLFRTEGPEVATITDGNHIHWQKIKVGRDFGTELEVLEGLAENTEVVENPTDDLREGIEVQVKRGGKGGAPPAQARSRRVLPGWSLATVRPHRLRPLADRFALRAPPLGSS